MTKKLLVRIISSLCLMAILVPLFSLSIFATDILGGSDYTYLSDIQERSASVGWKTLMKDKGLDDKPIKIGETTYDKGLVAHSPSKVEYNISGDEYESFHAYIGVNDSESDASAKTKADVEFIVMIDGVYAYKSKVFYYDTAPEEINIPIPYGSKRLTLITTKGGTDTSSKKYSTTADHCAWAEAKLIKRTSDLPIISQDKRLDQTLKSPSENLAVRVFNDENGRILFNVTEDKVVMLEDSAIGISSSLGDFSTGFSLKSVSAATIDETYTNISGSYSTVRNHANQMTAIFEKGEFLFTVEFRAYDDGFAYRYTIDAKDNSAKSIIFDKELGYFSVPASSTTFSEKITDLEALFNYEESYYELSIERCASTHRAFPFLFTPDKQHWMLLSEAELYGDTYAGSALYASGDNELRLCYAPKADPNGVRSKLSFTSPWRCGITGSLGDVVESSLIENVCERRDEDFSWVKPGVTSWLWLSEGGPASRDFEKLKKYVDLSAEMGWDYILLDSGWQPDAPFGYYDWFKTFMAYAKDKNVGVFVWVHYTNLDTAEERAVLKKWAADGIAGVKVDFFDSEHQKMITLYENIYKACEEAKLMVNIHGANKPTGERQYWPHVINREAVRGEEYKDYKPFDLTCYAFTRGVLGPMDITPLIVPGGTKTTTIASQLAMCVHYETGALTMASFATDYYESYATAFFKSLPSAWDDLKFIDGYPGDYSVLARRSGHNWYLSGITNEARSVKVNFDFLDEGAEYQAYIYTDGRNNEDVTVKKVVLKAGDSFDFSMLDGGGFAVKFEKLGVEDETPPTDTPDSTEKPTEPAVTESDLVEEEKGCGSNLSGLSVLAAVMLPLPFIKRN